MKNPYTSQIHQQYTHKEKRHKRPPPDLAAQHNAYKQLEVET